MSLPAPPSANTVAVTLGSTTKVSSPANPLKWMVPTEAASNWPILWPPAITLIFVSDRSIWTNTRSSSRLPVMATSSPVCLTVTGLVPAALAVILPKTPCASSPGPPV